MRIWRNIVIMLYLPYSREQLAVHNVIAQVRDLPLRPRKGSLPMVIDVVCWTTRERRYME